MEYLPLQRRWPAPTVGRSTKGRSLTLAVPMTDEDIRIVQEATQLCREGSTRLCPDNDRPRSYKPRKGGAHQKRKRREEKVLCETKPFESLSSTPTFPRRRRKGVSIDRAPARCT